jgi:hypothetical protein
MNSEIQSQIGGVYLCDSCGEHDADTYSPEDGLLCRYCIKPDPKGFDTMKGYTQERDKFLAVALEAGVSLSHAQEMLRLANVIQRHAINACNRETSAAEDERERAACEKLRLIAENHGLGARVDGDPRGYCVKLIFPSGVYNTWGGREEGYGVPTRF